MPTPYSDRALSIFVDALDLESTQRAEFVTQACGDDERLRLEVETLLNADAAAGSFLRRPLGYGGIHNTQLSPGRILSARFKIVRFISSGGMGEVYEAEDLVLRERVALKTIRSDVAADEETIERFKREIYLARKVTHTNVCRIFDLEQDRDQERGGILFLTMELLSGETLASRIRSAGPMSTADALPLVTQMAAALTAAHQAGIVHRDFKSGNVILVPVGESVRSVVTDFGLARGKHGETGSPHSLSRTGRIAGTPAYMAPEQVEGASVTPAADIYSLGIVMYEMVTGTLPFTGENAWSVAHKRLKEKAPSPRLHVPALDPKWEKAILRCLEREPENRFASAADVAAFLKGEIVSPSRRQKRRRLLVATSVIAVVIGAELAHTLLPKRAESRRSVAVLGFKNNTGRPDVAWVSTELSEGLRAELAAAGKLRTISGEEVAEFKKDFGLNDFDSLGKQTLARLHRSGADLVLVGSYTDLGKDAGGNIHLNVAIQDAARGETIDSLSASGAEKDIASLVSQTGARLRAKLGLGTLSPQREAELAIAQPNAEAAPLYSQALNELRAYNVSEARNLLEKSVQADPGYPFAHAALAQTWSILGYDARAKAEAKKALDLSTKLSLEDRLAIEGRYREMASDWNAAIESYSQLYRHFPDNLEYGLRLGHAQMLAGRSTVALETLASLRKLPPPQGDDPRINLEEAETAASIGDYKNAQAAARLAARAAQARGTKLLQSRALVWECSSSRHLGELSAARSACERAVRITSEIGDKLGAARAVNGLANIDTDEGNLEPALRRYEEAFRLSAAIGDKRDMSGALNNIGMLLAGEGRLPEARAKYEQALAIQQEIGFESEIPLTLNNLGDELHQEGKMDQALQTFEQAVAIARRNQNKNPLALGLKNLGAMSAERGDVRQAEQYYDEALSLERSMGAKRDIPATQQSIGDLVLAKGDLSGAMAHYREALAMQQELGDDAGAALSKVGLAAVLIEQKRFADAQAELSGTLPEFQKEKDSDSESLARALLARCFLEQHDAAAAQREIESARKLIGNSTLRGIRYTVGITAARVDSALGQPLQAKAVQSLENIQRDAAKTGMVAYDLEARLALAQIEIAQGRKAAGRTLLDGVRAEASAKGLGLIARKAGQTG